jgi:hypothetical protein
MSGYTVEVRQRPDPQRAASRASIEKHLWAVEQVQHIEVLPQSVDCRLGVDAEDAVLACARAARLVRQALGGRATHLRATPCSAAPVPYQNTKDTP